MITGGAAMFVQFLILVFFLSGLGWYIPGLSIPPTSTSPPSITCGTVKLLFYF